MYTGNAMSCITAHETALTRRSTRGFITLDAFHTWLARSNGTIRVTPVIDTDANLHVARYKIPHRNQKYLGSSRGLIFVKACYKQVMGRIPATILGLVAMVALIVGLDISFLRDHFALRLLVNIGIVAVFGIIYLTLRNRL